VPGGKEVRKDIEARVKEALAARSFRRLPNKQRFVSDTWVDTPLQAVLLLGVDTDRYGTVRLGGSAMVVAPAVEEFLLDSVPPTAMTKGQEIYYGRLLFGMAGTSFKRLVDPDGQLPLDWRAQTVEEGEAAVEGFLACVDGPVRRWFEEHSTVDRVRASVAPGGESAGDGSYIRTAATMEALPGHLDAGLALLERYRRSPQKTDSVDRVDAFVDWLRHAVAAQDPVV
jgi:hypothetical protein